MKVLFPVLTLAALLLAGCTSEANKSTDKSGAGGAKKDAAPPPDRKEAREALEKLGGEFTPPKKEEYTKINLQNSKATDDDLKWLAAFPEVKWVYLPPATTDAGLAHAVVITDLVRLYMPKSAVTDEGLAQLAVLSKLEVLDLSETKVTDAGLKHLATLTKLELLELQNTKVTDAGLPALEYFPKLIKVDLFGTKVTPKAANELRGKLKNTEVVANPK